MSPEALCPGLWKTFLIEKLWKTHGNCGKPFRPPDLGDWTGKGYRRLWKVGKSAPSCGQVIPNKTFFSTGFTPVFPNRALEDPHNPSRYPGDPQSSSPICGGWILGFPQAVEISAGVSRTNVSRGGRGHGYVPPPPPEIHRRRTEGRGIFAVQPHRPPTAHILPFTAMVREDT